MDMLKSASLASPKVVKNSKGNIVPSSQMTRVEYGCEHIQNLLDSDRKTVLQNYSSILHTIYEKHSIIAQTLTNTSGGGSRSFASLRRTCLCLQCTYILTEAERVAHMKQKQHQFTVDSREGYVYCGLCRDYIYDPELDSQRLRRGKKRKHDDAISPDDHKLIINNSTFPPCRATGLRGLYNMGQTCFMSVIIQSLIHNPFVRNWYLSEGHRSVDCEKETCASCALDEMFVEFYSNGEKSTGFGAVNMLLASWMSAESLAGYQQQDAHEYMQFILNELHLQNGGSSFDSTPTECRCVIHQVFQGKLCSTVTCDKCRNVTTALDPFMDLSLELRSQSKKRKLENGDAATGYGQGDASQRFGLYDCLERFTTREKLAAADYMCKNCGAQQSATKQLSVKRLPPVLHVHLKRFEHTKSASTKLETPVKFPMKLDLFPYTTGHKATLPPPKSKAASHAKLAASHNINSPTNTLYYELSSVIVHKGSIDSGHYVSYSREGDNWFLFDDSKVVLVSEAEVLAAQAYLLIYMVERIDT